MAAESTDVAVKQLHEELALFHEAEARRGETAIPAGEDLG